MIITLLKEYFEAVGCDDYYFRTRARPRGRSVDQWVGDLVIGNVPPIDGFTWHEFRKFVEIRYGQGLRDRVRAFISTWNESTFKVAERRYPDLAEELNFKISSDLL